MDKLLNNRFFQFMGYLFRQFVENQGILNAAALTYTTLFAVVPLMTVTFAMLSAVPSFQGLEQELKDWIFANFVPGTGEVLQEYLSAFSQQARKLTALGVVVLAVTSIMMMKNFEAAFNRIWRVTEPRKGLSSFLLYWAVLSLGPILLGLGLVVTSYLASISFVSSATEAVGRARLLSILPTLLSAMAFTLMYAAVPNCRVPFRSALLGGIVVAMLFESAKRGFTAFVTQFPSYELIYGAFAAVPLFLLWVFISWVIILMGAELTRSVTIYKAMMRKAGQPHIHTIIGVLYLLWKAQREGRSVSDRVLLQQVNHLDQGRWDAYLNLLLDGGIIKRSDEGEYLLSMDMGVLTIQKLQNLLPWPLPNAPETSTVVQWQQEFNKRLLAVNQAQQEQFDISFEALFSLNGSTEPERSKGGNKTEERIHGS